MTSTKQNKTLSRDALLTAILVTVAITLIIFINLIINQPPAVISSEAPPEVFSAERAAMHLPPIASRPNPIGSKANEEVLNYVCTQLEAMGYEPEVHTTSLFSSYRFFHRVAYLNNLLLKIPGTQGDQTILIMGHYDTVINAPGASDNGAAVVTMLEVLRMLEHHPPMKNNLVFFFPDGEEYGLLGAQAFKEQHPWAENIDLIINLEAMGTSGQSIMFETGENNLNIIRDFAGTVPYPVGNSMTVEVYKRIGTATDYNVFKHDGYQGLNFAYIGNSFDYHTAGDNIENTDLRSIQHHGSHLAALLLHFGNVAFEPNATQNAVYFNTIGYGFVHYPYGWVPAISVIVALIALLLIVKGVRDQTINLLRLLFSVISFAIQLLIIYLASDAAFEILKSIYPGGDYRLLQYNQLQLLFWFSLIAVAFSMAFFHMISSGVKKWHLSYLFSWLILLVWAGGDGIMLKSLIVLALAAWIIWIHRKPTNTFDLWTAAIIVWIVLILIVSFLMPGASYLVVWPLVIALVPFGLSVFNKKMVVVKPLYLVVFLVFSIPLLSWFPVIMKLFIEAMGPALIPVTMVVAGLVMGLLIPSLYLITRRKPWLIPGILFLTGLFFLLFKATGFEYNERYRKQNQVIYATDANTGQVFWMGSKDGWTAQFLSEATDTIPLNRFYPANEGEVLAKASHYPPRPSAEVSLLADTMIHEERKLSFHVRTPSETAHLNLYVNSGPHTPSMQIINKERIEMIPTGETPWHMLQVLAPPGDGFSFSIFTKPGQEVILHLLEIDYSGIPEFVDYKERPAHMMSSGDRTITASRYAFK